MLFTTARHPGAIILAAVVTVIGLSAPLANAADVVKLGAPLALTGSLADEAKKQNVIWKMWLAKVNAAGGINVGGKKSKVELVVYDYQSDGQRAGQLGVMSLELPPRLALRQRCHRHVLPPWWYLPTA